MVTLCVVYVIYVMLLSLLSMYELFGYFVLSLSIGVFFFRHALLIIISILFIIIIMNAPERMHMDCGREIDYRDINEYPHVLPINQMLLNLTDREMNPRPLWRCCLAHQCMKFIWPNFSDNIKPSHFAWLDQSLDCELCLCMYVKYAAA